ncbi:MAG: hypothetical protein Fur0024_0630 [Patescibacteria group bacterium]
MKKKLIVTAHDFGFTHSVNEGILFALNHPQNIFTELSLLAVAPGSTEGARIARENPQISTHLCISLMQDKFKPITKPKTLVDRNGYFFKGATDTWDFSAIDNFDDKEVRDEVFAQYEWFVKNVGRKPSAIVSQKSEHGDPKILIHVSELAKKENLPVRTPLWKWKPNYGAETFIDSEGLKHTSSCFVGLLDWKGRFGYDLEADLDKLIEDINLKNGVSEVFIFCGFVDEETINLSSVNWQRGQILNIMERKPHIIQKIRENFDLISYRDL